MSCWLVTISTVAAVVSCVMTVPLEDYVNKPDPHYSYTHLGHQMAAGVTLHLLNMTSQKWLTDKVTNHPVWWHFVGVIVPDVVDYSDTAFLYIHGGDNVPASLPDFTDTFIDDIRRIAQTTRSVTAIIRQIPNQPVVFQDELEYRSRREDDITAWTWKQFMESGGSDPEVLIHLPMSKAVVRAMDTVISFVQNYTGNTIDKFVLAGRSKRGWTTWLTAAVDKRVVGIVPTVMDLLNFKQNLRHHFRALGGWSYAFVSYHSLNLTQWIDTPALDKLAEIVDPLNYNDRLTMPKLLVTAAGDEFFLIDDSHFYFQQLHSPKYLQIIPNVGHSLGNQSNGYVSSLTNFYLTILDNSSLPTISWNMSQTSTGGKISVKASQLPRSVKVFHATTRGDIRRDFRLNDPLLPGQVTWFEQAASKLSDLEYEYELAKPQTGWAAFFIQLTFDGVKNTSTVLTTQANVVPDTYPFADCDGKACLGGLVKRG